MTSALTNAKNQQSNAVEREELDLKHVIDITESFLLFMKQLQNVTELIDRQDGVDGSVRPEELVKEHGHCKCEQHPIHKKPKCTCRKSSNANVGTSSSTFTKEIKSQILSSTNATCRNCDVIKTDVRLQEDQSVESLSNSKRGRKRRTGKHVSNIIKALTSQFQGRRPQ